MTDSNAVWDGTGVTWPVPGEWYPLPPPFSKYEVSFDGFGPDQRPVRRLGGTSPLATQPSNHGEYLLVKPYDDNGKRQTVPVHRLVLLGGDGACPPGLQSCHLDDDPLNNRWRPGSTEDERRAAGGNLIYGTGLRNARHKFLNGGQAPTPKAYECVNHARCGGMVANEGSRCKPCAVEVGIAARVMLDQGLNLVTDVTPRLDYKSPDWVWKLAVKYGGYTGSLAQARAQQPPRLLKVTTTLRTIFRRGLRDGS